MRGYAIFETLKFINKKALSIDNHMDRLFKSLSFIKIDSDKIKRDNLVSDINRIIEINGWKDGLIKIIVTRGEVAQNVIVGA